MATKPMQASSMNNPQQTFESALALMRQDGAKKGAASAARTVPIGLARNDQEIEKRALTDAARALARLWNISPHPVR